MTTALYRRYRPDTFAEVIGQDHVTGPLRAALRANKVTHAYLFSGPRGCGKTTSARILARCLNCAEGPTDTPCGVCDSCRELATGGAGSLDVVEIDAASHGGVDDARELREKATFAPVRDRYKVFIIDEAHMVTNQGFNALLKLVEEPPEHVKFVFATTEPDRVIGTIRSRTHHYPFRLVPPDVLGPYLHRLAEEEQVGIGQGVLPMVMRAGGGSVRDTLSVLDQLMAGSIDGEVSYETAVALLGYTDTTLLDETVDALAGGDGAAAYRVVERMVESGHDPRRFVEDLLQRLRDLLIIAVAGDGAGDVLSDVPSDQFERMHHQAANWGPRNLSRAADLADEALRQMTGATSPRLQLELLIGRILVPPSRPAVQPIEESAVPGTVGTPSGGAPHEDAGRFGAREAREALARSRRGGPTAPASAPAAPDRPAPDRPAPGRYEDAASAPTSGVAPAPASGPRAAEPWPQALAPGANAPTSAPPEKPGAGPRADAGTGAAPAPSDGHSAVPAGPGAAGSPRTTPAPPEGSAWPEVSTPAPAAPEPAREAQGPVRDTPAASEQAQQAAASTGRQADMIRGRWEDVLERLKAMSRVAWALVSGSSQLGAVDGSELVLIFPNDALAANFARKDHALVVAEAVYEVTGVRVSVSERVGQAAGGPAVSAPSALASDQDPQGQDGWVSEPPPFEHEQAPEAFSSQDPRSAPEPDAPARADAAEALPSPALGEPDEETSTPEPAPSSATPATSAPDAPGSAAPGSARASAAHAEGGAVIRAHAGYTNGPKRRAISVFTYDEADPEHSPGKAAEPRSQSPRADSATRPDEQGTEPEPRTEPDYRAEPSSTDRREPPAAPASPDAPVDDGWGPVAVPGGASSSETPAWSPEPAQPWSPAPAWSPEPPAPRASDASAPWGPAGSPAPSEPGPATPWETRSPASRPAMAGWSESPAAPGGVSFEDSASTPTPNAARNEAADAAGADDPADRTGGPRPGGAGAPSSTPPVPSSPGSDDSPSLDDEDIEVSTRFGVPAILDILGGTVIEEIYDEGSR